MSYHSRRVMPSPLRHGTCDARASVCEWVCIISLYACVRGDARVNRVVYGMRLGRNVTVAYRLHKSF